MALAEVNGVSLKPRRFKIALMQNDQPRRIRLLPRARVVTDDRAVKIDHDREFGQAHLRVARLFIALSLAYLPKSTIYDGP